MSDRYQVTQSPSGRWFVFDTVVCRGVVPPGARVSAVHRSEAEATAFASTLSPDRDVCPRCDGEITDPDDAGYCAACADLIFARSSLIAAAGSRREVR